MADLQFIAAFRFRVGLRRSLTVEANNAGTAATLAPAAGESLIMGDGEGAFQECSGLEVEVDVQEYLEGGRNDGVVRRVGRAKYSNIVLKRGMFLGTGTGLNVELWRWLQDVVSGARVRRYDGTIEVLNAQLSPVATWTFSRGLPARIKGPELNAKTGEIALEELHIAHEGLALVLPALNVGGKQ
ncbi:phage tail protein [Nannocystis sp.]|uniref:phage tail protein n=1 Tax=Nannocystis sp. TaxID=1962667 RepID=UPI002421562D|nr:phage tail protein [Nannocystis sp.]MBK7823664.1 phage tail protein [Nannocystis sp.]MBK9755824.1 phage tail protein [Nannocystis sp.]